MGDCEALKPYIYTVCDTGYRDLYADVFVNGARAAGHEVEVFCSGRRAETRNDKTWLCMWRFQMLPDLLKKHGAALMVDIDSIIQRPTEIEPEYDLGLFLRPNAPRNMLTFCSILYCTERAMPFAEEIARCCKRPGLKWMDDQAIVWDAYKGLGHNWKIKKFDEDFISWRNANARIFTGKGAVKHGPAFGDLSRKWAVAAA
jgi:hypothetical protein